MDASNYVGLSSILALERRLTTIAHNVANASTPGFRSEEISFKAIVSEVSEPRTAFASLGQTYLSRASGPLRETGNPLDVAVKGDAWLALETPAGRVYTRDGRLDMGPDGGLRSVNGYPVLDASGAPLLVDPAGGPPTIAADGMITQRNRQVGAIGLFQIPANANLRRFDNSAVISDRDAEPILQFTDAGVQQGYLEDSNVNPVLELTHLIQLSRTFDAVMSSIDANQSTQKTAIRTLGAGTG